MIPLEWISRETRPTVFSIIEKAVRAKSYMTQQQFDDVEVGLGEEYAERMAVLRKKFRPAPEPKSDPLRLGLPPPHPHNKRKYQPQY